MNTPNYTETFLRNLTDDQKAYFKMGRNLLKILRTWERSKREYSIAVQAASEMLFHSLVIMFDEFARDQSELSTDPNDPLNDKVFNELSARLLR